MKILMISPYPTRCGMIRGGVEAVTAALAPAVSDHPDITRLIVLSFYTGGDPPSRTVTELGKLTVIQLHAQRRLATPTFLFLDWLRAGLVSAWVCPDIVHGQGINSSGFLATHLNHPSVVTIHGVTPVEIRKGQHGPWSKARIKLVDVRVASVLQRAKVVISTSKYDAELVGSQTKGRLVSIPNPVPDVFFADPVNIGAGILFAGVLSERKNVAGLLRAISQVVDKMPSAHLTILGPDGDEKYGIAMRTLTKELHLEHNVSFLGHVSQEVLVAEMRKCGVLVLFSEEETSPTVIAQAMAVGKPVVSSAVGGVPDMVSNGETGWLVPVRDEKALAERIVALLSNKETRLRMGLLARSLVADRLPEVVAQKTVEAYHTLK